ncbi:hypothetical protein [Enterobacter asburiae]|uniref:hypothetical protein n=1 Tax=Enterobacter asburiae TaxID=61645 RepID=UPI002075F4E2|nr:hypothetical protein [Enterobacter asburiae]MCM7648273.1 hypothetical protein [Enterobacter asburiae]
MSAITKEFTKEQLQQIIETDHVQCGEASALARIALASLESEPVAWLLSGGGAKNHVSFDSGNAYADPLREVTPLYTAPPAPVSVPDEDLLHMAASAIDDLLSNKDRSGAGVWADIPAKLRRAAMLQGAENAESRCTIKTAPALDSLTKNAESRCGNSPVIPEGWVLVPEEPTHEMLEAGDEQFGTYDVYRRMIEAAPKLE